MIAVVGSGIAGTAAALAARAQGEEVTLVRGAAGATILAPGLVDDDPWQHAREPRPLSDAEMRVLDALSLHRIAQERALAAVTTGIVRPARGIDRALLDLARVPKGVVLVPEVEREGWDAPALARALSESEISRARGLVFEAVPAQLLLHTEDRTLPDPDIAARYDDPAQLAKLAQRLRAMSGIDKAAAVVLPPWLGAKAPRAEALSAMLEIPCGEIAASPGSTAGVRFGHARDRALASAGVNVIGGFVDRIGAEGDMCILHMSDAEALQASAVVVASGGLVGGGIVYTPSEAFLATALPRNPRPPFECSPAGAGTLGHDGAAIDVPGSLFGVQPEMLAWPFIDPAPMEQIGILTCPRNVFVAGDVMADRPRTFLAALRSGVAAAHEAAGASGVKRPSHRAASD